MAPASAPHPIRVLPTSDSSHLPATPTSSTTARRRDDLERVRDAIRRHLLLSASPVSPALPPERWRGRQASSSIFTGKSLPTGIAALDRALLSQGGGLPRGVLTEITGPLSSGKTSLAFSAIAAAQRRGEPVAYVDPARSFHAPSAARAGVDLDRLLLVFPPDENEALRVADLVLRSRGFALVVLDLPWMCRVAGNGQALFRLARLARAVETALVALTTEGDEGALRSAVSLRLAVRPEGLVVEGGGAALVQGYRATVEVVKDRASGLTSSGRAPVVAFRRPFPLPLVDPPAPLADAVAPAKRNRRDKG
jgi:hypothetical protein